MDSLSGLPNLGPKLVKTLAAVEIFTPEELVSTGSKQAFMKIRAHVPDACIDMLFALEGAIQGIRWHHLDTGTKTDLKEFFQLLEKTERHD